MCYIIPKSCSIRTRQNCSSIGHFLAQEEGQEVREAEEIKVLWFKEIKKGGGRIKAIDADEDITLMDAETHVDLGVKLQGRKDDVSATATKEASAAKPTPDKDVEEPQKKRVVEETMLQESFKKLKAVEISGSHSTQDNPTHDPKEMFEEDVQNMLEIVIVSEFKVEALQVKYPLIDWEIHSEGSRTYWKIIRVGGITEAYQSFEDMLKGFDREDLDALWRFIKEKFSTVVPTVDKEKAL
nr:hypothetical protein [Tanacetum cinerariifolium]